MMKQTMKILELAPATLAWEVQGELLKAGDPQSPTDMSPLARAAATASAIAAALPHGGVDLEQAKPDAGGGAMTETTSGRSEMQGTDAEKSSAISSSSSSIMGSAGEVSVAGLVPGCVYELGIEYLAEQQQHVVVYQPRQQQPQQEQEQQQLGQPQIGQSQGATEHLSQQKGEGEEGHAAHVPQLAGGLSTATAAAAGGGGGGGPATGKDAAWRPDAETLDLIQHFPGDMK
jgi:hypothetical protein